MSLVFIESLDIQLSGKEILTDINLNIEKLEPIANDNAKVKELILEFIE